MKLIFCFHLSLYKNILSFNFQICINSIRKNDAKMLHNSSKKNECYENLNIIFFNRNLYFFLDSSPMQFLIKRFSQKKFEMSKLHWNWIYSLLMNIHNSIHIQIDFIIQICYQNIFSSLFIIIQHFGNSSNYLEILLMEYNISVQLNSYRNEWFISLIILSCGICTYWWYFNITISIVLF